MKKILLGVLVIILTGCTAKVNVNVDINNKVSEDFKIVFLNSAASKYETPKKYAENYLEYYKSAINYKEYTYDIIEGKKESYVKFKKQSDDLCKSIENNLFSQNLYKSITCNENEFYITINSVGEQLIAQPMSKKAFNIEKVSLSLTLPISAEENNADRVNNNTYTWEFDEYSPATKSIYIKINKKSIEEKREEIRKTEQHKNTFSKIGTIAIILGIITSLLVVSYLVYKKAMANRIEL